MDDGQTNHEPGSNSSHTVLYDEREMVATLSRPWTNRPVSYLKEVTALQRREHFFSAGVRKRQRVRTICVETRHTFQHLTVNSSGFDYCIQLKEKRFGHIFQTTGSYKGCPHSCNHSIFFLLHVVSFIHLDRGWANFFGSGATLSFDIRKTGQASNRLMESVCAN